MEWGHQHLVSSWPRQPVPPSPETGNTKPSKRGRCRRYVPRKIPRHPVTRSSVPGRAIPHGSTTMADANAARDGDNIRQAAGDAAPQDNSQTPEQDGDHEKNRLGRRSTMKGKFKDQKEKLKTKANPPGGFDPTPFRDAPPGYTVKFTFHRAENLPTADISTGASDPFLTATLSTALPKRHKEDADLCYRTRTIRRCLEPQWDEEWIVANVPSTGFRLKCRLYDEDWPDHNDRLGNVTIYVSGINESWRGFSSPGNVFDVKKRMGSKRAYALKAAASAFHKDVSMTPRLYVSAEVVGKSDPPHGQIYTVGPTYYFKHFSPMIGRMTGIKVNKDEAADAQGDDNTSSAEKDGKHANKKAQKYDFQANEIQLAGPVPEKLYHRFVEFRPIIGLLFQSTGLRGHILNKALHHQHDRIYNFDKSTEWGTFKPCSEEASLQFLKLVHFDEGAHHEVDGRSSKEIPPAKPQYYQLIIDNDSGTYRPDKSVLPDLRQFLERNFPGLKIVTPACDDPDHQKLKEHQRNLRKKTGRNIRMVLNRSPSASSFSSSDISHLDDMEEAGDEGRKSKKERAWEILEEPRRIKEALGPRPSNTPVAGPSTSHTDRLHTNGDGIAA
ncbi:hypothetical protein O1611_g3296 [Lasiodiplodia mahajangana]|uniref:Uncharacterized protein n=1 Tax=Lasiodiplodia mahajangana TaxID=1108764 RepID=A0ACC2JSE6_9PEZI|nr:hypothetical protein O1611_g3296 [Lasiodiplodia mahajangana]